MCPTVGKRSTFRLPLKTLGYNGLKLAMWKIGDIEIELAIGRQSFLGAAREISEN